MQIKKLIFTAIVMIPAPDQIQENIHGVSVIICCYNSAQRIPETLAHLSSQIVPAYLPWEVLLIDNASSDGTDATATRIWDQLLPGSKILKILYEPKPGQQFARLCGARAARYDLILFCDDDNWLDPNYIFYSSNTMQQNARIGAAGGQNEPVTNADQYPDWFESYRDKYALGIPASQSGDTTQRGFVLGAGMLTRKSLFLETYSDKYPSLLKGRNGEILNTGDDFEYCKRIILRDWHLYYEENMKLKHFIPKERLTIPYRDRLMQGIREATLVLSEYDQAISLRNRYKNKNRWRLLFLTPFRVLFVRLGLMNRNLTDERLTFFYLTPFNTNENSVRKKIKDFIYGW